MKKRCFLPLILATIAATGSYAQQFVGYNYNNYGGVNNVVLNPASVADSKFKLHVNVLSLSFLGGNNAYELQHNNMFKLKFDDLQENTDFFKSSNTDRKKLWLNTDVIGPSFQVATGAKSAFAITTRARTIVNTSNLSDGTFRLFGKTDPAFYNLDIQENNVYSKIHAFADLGLAYGRLFHIGGAHWLKVGITAKYVIGMGFGSARSNNLLVNVGASEVINKLNGDATVQYSSNIDQLDNSNFSDVLKKNAGRGGWGLDAGVVYEWRTEGFLTDPIPYKIRVGASVTDIGSVKYDNSIHGQSYLLAGAGKPTSDLRKKSGESYEQYFSRLETQGIMVAQGMEKEMKVSLPTAAHVNVDWHIYKRLFLNADALINIIKKTSISPNYITTIALTPRLEKKWFSIYSPVVLNAEKEFSWGAGIRVGPVFAGSGSVLSNWLIDKNIAATDFHVGVNIPIFQPRMSKKKKTEPKIVEVVKEVNVTRDRDNDGVVDDRDDCPDSTGVIALNGCPDRDGDMVADKDDKCPDVAGSPKYKGCPVPDSDGDGINDDEDKCPHQRGLSENHGCPEIKKEVIRRVNTAAKSVYFMTNRDIIQKKSYIRLDTIARILKADPTLNLTIEGHTDNLGSKAFNKSLSEKRATAIKKYLERKGIAGQRMNVIGYGSARPIADNRTLAGRAKNRRVQMVLRNW